MSATTYEFPTDCTSVGAGDMYMCKDGACVMAVTEDTRSFLDIMEPEAHGIDQDEA